MSELKAETIIPQGTTVSLQFYPKSEADRVIAHQKYKRCLDKAALCERKRIDAADYRIPREKWEFYDKWHKRWLELAEKFKEAKYEYNGRFIYTCRAS